MRFSAARLVFVFMGLLWLCGPPLTQAAPLVQSDLCVFGATSAGVAAAVEAAHEGRKVVLTEFGGDVGGMTAGGLSQTDIGNKGAIGGLARGFYQRIGSHYGTNEAWKFEPSVAELAFQDMLSAAGVTVYFHQHLASVKTNHARLESITMEDGTIFRARVFIDASYEGDLMAKTGVSYIVGREANATYHEALDGIRAVTPKHQFTVAVDPYLRPGDPSSGLLPFIQDQPPGQAGEGDHSVQAYNFRLCLTQNPTNKLAINPAADYDPARYELLARYIEALAAAGKPLRLEQFMNVQPMPHGKTDLNNNGGFSTDFIGGNAGYADGSYAERARIWQAHEDYTRGLLHFLATSSRVPPALRAEMQSWGLCKDEFTDTGGWPHQLYIREARRMVSDYVMTENNCRLSIELHDPVGLAAYTMDSHNCRRIVREGRVENEGDVQVGGFPPYQISYRSIVPKESECENLLVPVCLSASHIAYGSIRMEPVFMVLGQSAAIAAGLTLDQKVAVQKISYDKLRRRLLAAGQVLEWPPPPAFSK
jgi:FAD dependent oxidoreductase